MSKRPALPDHETMVANIVATFERASASQVERGRVWYRAANCIVSEIGLLTETPTHIVAYVLAALSPRNPWAWNVADAYAFCTAFADSQPMPTATTFKRNARNAWVALEERRYPWRGPALKVRAFVDAIMGECNAVVVDTWAARVATNGEVDYVPGVGAYRAIAAAYSDAARRVHMLPVEVQAITWLVAQSGGINRPPKSGTPSVVIAMLEDYS
jgi:hypothetical protein